LTRETLKKHITELMTKSVACFAYGRPHALPCVYYDTSKEYILFFIEILIKYFFLLIYRETNDIYIYFHINIEFKFNNTFQ